MLRYVIPSDFVAHQEGVGKLLKNALVAKYEAAIREGAASLAVYFSSSVGIGEHPQHVEEMDKILEAIASADDKLAALCAYFPSSDP